MKAARSVIALTTDFGADDVFVGVMKGVILSINPSAHIVDLTHGIAPFGVVEAAYKLAQAVPYFPCGAVHAVVVDPGVGSGRRIVAVCARGGLFVAPDNGVLTCVMRDGVEQAVEVRERRYWLCEVSSTFHGRDVFAPVAAHLSRGIPLDELGPPASDLVTLDLPEPVCAPDGSILGEVLWTDRFGNLVTNIPAALVARGEWSVLLGESSVGSLRRTYADVEPAQPVAMVGSFGHLEIAVRLDSAARRFGAGPGAAVRVVPVQPGL